MYGSCWPLKGKVNNSSSHFPIQNIASMRLSAHSLRCELSYWCSSKDAHCPCMLCINLIHQFEYLTQLECSIFNCIQAHVLGIFNLQLSTNRFLTKHNVHSKVQYPPLVFSNVENQLLSHTHTHKMSCFDPISPQMIVNSICFHYKWDN